MKQFAVLMKIGAFGATVVREFDAYADAVAFASLLTKSEDNEHTKYYVASDIKSLEGITLPSA